MRALNRRLEKKRLAERNRTKNTPNLNFIVGCPRCEWVIGQDRKTRQPVEIRIGFGPCNAVCKQGHKLRVK
jgi:hypothetical protein